MYNRRRIINYIYLINMQCWKYVQLIGINPFTMCFVQSQNKHWQAYQYLELCLRTKTRKSLYWNNLKFFFFWRTDLSLLSFLPKEIEMRVYTKLKVLFDHLPLENTSACSTNINLGHIIQTCNYIFWYQSIKCTCSVHINWTCTCIYFCRAAELLALF